MSSSHDPFAPGGGAPKPPNEGPTDEQPNVFPNKQETPYTQDADSAAGEAPAGEGTTPPAVSGQAEPANEAPEADTGTGTDVPAGTAKEVLDWVGDDKSRAQAALDAERASSEPRKGLTKELEERVG